MTDCFYHLDRIGKKVPATRESNGVPMCKNCFTGKPVTEKELAVGVDTKVPSRHMIAKENNRLLRQQKAVARRMQVGDTRKYAQ